MAAPRPAPGLPLDGITVVSLEQAVAAPYATRQLADLGARVIKVERPGGGDFARTYDSSVKGLVTRGRNHATVRNNEFNLLISEERFP